MQINESEYVLSGKVQMFCLQSGRPRSDHMLDAVIDEQRTRGFRAMPLQNVVVDGSVRFTLADLPAVIGSIEQGLEIRDPVLPFDDGRERLHVNGVGIAEQQYLIAGLQPLDECDPFRGDGAEHGVPAVIDVFVRDVPAMELPDTITDVYRGKRSCLETIEKMVLLRLAVESVEIREA